MAERKVIWTRTAARQRRCVLEYWKTRNQSVDYSTKLIKMISDRITLIQQYPSGYVETEVQGVRMSSMGHYSICYLIDGDDTIVVAFWDNRQDPQKLLRFLSE